MSNDNLSIFQKGWEGKDTVCGWGSMLEHTGNVAVFLHGVFSNPSYPIVLDAGCGDLFWLEKHVNPPLDQYIGIDLFERASWPRLKKAKWDLRVANIVEDELPKADIIFCRDVFIHLPNEMIVKALWNFYRTGAKKLISTTYENADNTIRMSEPRMKYAALDLTSKPFNLGEAEYMINEDFPGKKMGVWNL